MRARSHSVVVVMTISRFINRDDVTGFKTWKAPVVGGQDMEVEELPVVTAETIEAIQESAKQEGFAEGKVAGIKAGRVEGVAQGRVKGLEQGRQEGLAAGAAKVKQQVEQLKEVLDALQAPLKELDEVVADEVVTLAIAIAQQIIRREIHTDPGQVIAVAREALQLLPVTTESPRIWLHPEDAALLRLQLSEQEISGYQLMEDGALSRGGCKVENSQARVDATIEKQIHSVVAELFGSERGGERHVVAASAD